MPPSPTQLARLALGSADPVDFALNYQDFDPGVREELFDGNRTKGTYDKDGNLVVPNLVRVEPRLDCVPTASEMDRLLAWGMGGAVTGTTTKSYALGDDPLQQNLHWRTKNGKEWFLSGVVADVFTLAAGQGDGLRATFELVGQGYTDTRADFPGSLVLDQVKRPWVLSNLVFTYAAVVRKSRRFEFTVRHMVDRNRHLSGSLFLAGLVKQDQQITLAAEIPDGDNAGVWNTGETGAAASAVFTNAGGSVLTVTLPDVHFGPSSPVYPSKNEGYLMLQGECYRVGSGRPASVTLTQ